MPVNEHFDRAVSLHRTGKLQEAAPLYRNVLASQPDHFPALLMMTRLERQRGRPESAMAYLRRAAAAQPHAVELIGERALLALMSGDLALAEAKFYQWLQAQPDNAVAHDGLGMVFRQQGRWPAAATEFARALQCDPQAGPERRLRLATALTHQGDADSAVSLCDDVLALDPDNIRARFSLGLALAARGDFDAACECYRAVLALRPAFAAVHQQLANARRFSEPDDPDLVAARDALAIPGMPDHGLEKLHFALGKGLDDCGRYDDAFAHFRQANSLQRRRNPRFDRAGHRQFIDRTIAVFSSAAMTRLRRPDESPETPLLVLGMPRSGTTLVEQILSGHSGVAAGGELSYLSHQFLNRVQPWPEAVLHGDGAALAAVADGYRELLKEFARGGGLVTDKFPGNFLFIGAIKALFPKAHIVDVHRDARDNCVSIYTQDFQNQHVYSSDLEDIAFYYREYERLMQHWFDLLPGEILRLEYEQLVRRPEDEVRRLLAYCGLEWEADCLDFSKNPRSVASLSNWQVRQPLYSASVDRWRHYAPHLESLTDALA